jgi:rubredoxin
MTVTLETRVTCPECGHKIRFIAVTTVRVNKRSIRDIGTGPVMLGALEDWRCPGCRTEIPRDRPLDREPYRLVAEDAVRVAEYRKAKWGIEE